MKMELILNFKFEASHSLSGYEVPHSHLWRLELAIQGQPINGLIVDLVQMRAKVELIIQNLRHSYLNENSYADLEVRNFPTCESLAQFFKTKISQVLLDNFLPLNPSLKISSILVAIAGQEGVELGAARLILE